MLRTMVSDGGRRDSLGDEIIGGGAGEPLLRVCPFDQISHDQDMFVDTREQILEQRLPKVVKR